MPEIWVSFEIIVSFEISYDQKFEYRRKMGLRVNAKKKFMFDRYKN